MMTLEFDLIKLIGFIVLGAVGISKVKFSGNFQISVKIDVDGKFEN